MKDLTRKACVPPASETSHVREDDTTIATVLAQTIRSMRGSAVDGETYEGLLAELSARPGAARLVQRGATGHP